jgi:hypothetical protein
MGKGNEKKKGAVAQGCHSFFYGMEKTQSEKI